MQESHFGKAKIPVSVLGLGCMRLPTQNGQPDGHVDENAAIEMIQYAVDNGVRYIDTAKVYHNETSEKIVGKALKNGYRAKVLVATKLPPWGTQSLGDVERIFHEQCDDLRTETIDVYLLHCLNTVYWSQFQKMGIFKWLEEKKSQGRIKHVGFSFHDNYSVFTDILDAYDWDVCQIQYNYVGENVQAGKAGLEYAAKKGVSVVVMEPLFGGALANPPEHIAKIFSGAGKNPVDLALRWACQQQGVSVVLSGMSSLQQLKDNLSFMDNGCLTEEENNFLAAAKLEYAKMHPIPCSQCRYCGPCKSGVDIPGIFQLYNDSCALPDNAVLSRNLYGMLSPSAKAESCDGCGECEKKCPQAISIRKELKKAARHLTSIV